MTAEPAVLVERSGSRCDVVLNRPYRRNAVNLDAVHALTRALHAAEQDDSVGAVVLRGAGGCFCSGIDLKDLGSQAEFTAAWTALHTFIDSMRTPLVGAIEHAAVNAGAALALACDVVVAGESSFLQVKEAAMGMTPPVNVAWLVTRHSTSLARRLTLTCDAVPGAELVQVGIAARCVADAEVVRTAQKLADAIASYPQSGGARVKAVIASAAGGGQDGFLGALTAIRG
ncbi:enoyl-CoA hydratase/isomerase family protein [Blastococcus goldschmidtiae]|uniref:Enoyl-CoA hydratase/isomerase family protein n=1 Tax=Blastococcus goldschmidtiae TaxID=3075546 RepID=A0ABU2K6W0_9ACTN|nr:enoyl-CoA hydratase/isomerase family protein [Blastococcus sp. DSM 46792]MDT0275935.1 enoyl-CoA hydratase/isomerase family protein [Blastococcus sp. DSM 46792]